MTQYTCFNCLVTYKKRNDLEWNDDKAKQEFNTLYPEAKNYPFSILCEDCYKLFKKWFSTLTEEEKLKMRMEYN